MKLEDGEYYVYEDGELKPFDPLTYKYNGYTITKLYELYKDRKELVKRLNKYRDKLIKENERLKGDTLYKVIDNLIQTPTLDILYTQDKYFVFDKEGGYISKALSGTDIGKYPNLPNDIENGYYYIKNGEIKKDKKREEEILWILAF